MLLWAAFTVAWNHIPQSVRLAHDAALTSTATTGNLPGLGERHPLLRQRLLRRRDLRAHVLLKADSLSSDTHMMSGIDVAAAGVIPYVDLRGRGVFFLVQDLVNGSRAGMLSDFGGRREPTDSDPFFTAARELSEETDGIFGDVDALAKRLRRDASVRILNRMGRYVTFFLKVDYIHAPMISAVDTTATLPTARECRWIRAEQVMARAERGTVLQRLVVPPSIGGTTAAGPSSLDRAVLKTLALENCHPQAYERWQCTVLPTLLEDAALREEEQRLLALQSSERSEKDAARRGREGRPKAQGARVGGSKAARREATDRSASAAVPATRTQGRRREIKASTSVLVVTKRAAATNSAPTGRRRRNQRGSGRSRTSTTVDPERTAGAAGNPYRDGRFAP
uniref:Nudix hydrolase domain-containing protein n=1 Tax=Coccolithus braarudii TaxID=221442 RepID=A0A7S0LQ63_9EUKA